MKERRPIPAKIQEEALYLADHTCCICRAAGKDVQLHHIDGNPANSSVVNLAVLCLDHHSQVTGTRGLGKAYKPGEVRRYKRAWELQTQDRRKLHRPIVRHERELISQIDLIVCEILALDSRATRVTVLFDLLFQLNLWRGSRKISANLLDGLGHLAIMCGSTDDRKAKHIPELIWQLCWHFVGPTEVPMKKDDVVRIKRCVEIMDTLADFACSYGHGRKTISSITTQTENLFEIALWYSRDSLADRVIGLYEKALKASRSEEPFPFGERRLRSSIRRMRNMLKEQKPAWKLLARRLAKLGGRDA